MATAIVPAEEKGLTKIQNYLEDPIVQARFAKIMGERGASNYIASVLIAVADSKSLQDCTPMSVYVNALRAATLRLSVDPGVGQAYLVPFGARATLIIGYKGLHDMAVRTNRYRYINVGPIYEGQEIIEDQITGFHRIEGRRTGDKVIGWIGAFEMLPKFGGYSKTMYMTVEEIHEHAKKYSASYNRKDSPWHTETPKMERKTVLRLLLRRWGYIDPADVQALEELERDQPETIEAEFNTLAESMEQGPEVKNSPAATISILTGDGNPDPVKEDTWSDWLAWKARAEKQNIRLSSIDRGAITENDLRAYIVEIAPGIRDAEEQAKAE